MGQCEPETETRETQRETGRKPPKPPLCLALDSFNSFLSCDLRLGDHKTPTYLNLARGGLHLVEIRVPESEKSRDQGQIASAGPVLHKIPVFLAPAILGEGLLLSQELSPSL